MNHSINAFENADGDRYEPRGGFPGDSRLHDLRRTPGAMPLCRTGPGPGYYRDVRPEDVDLEAACRQLSADACEHRSPAESIHAGVRSLFRSLAFTAAAVVGGVVLGALLF